MHLSSLHILHLLNELSPICHSSVQVGTRQAVLHLSHAAQELGVIVCQVLASGIMVQQPVHSMQLQVAGV